MDKIYIRGLRVYAYHGVKETEKEKGQPFELDITLEADLRRPGATDDLKDTVNYSKVTKRVLAVMQAEKNDLIERAAQQHLRYPVHRSASTRHPLDADSRARGFSDGAGGNPAPRPIASPR